MITTAVKTDGPLIQAITAHTGVFTQQEVDCVAELWNEYLQKGPESSGYYFLVDREGEHISGFACYGPHSLTEGTFDLYWIAVDPADRRTGSGRKLLTYTEETVRAMGGHLLVAETSGLEKYAATRAFYVAAGYTLEATLHDFYSQGDDLVFFTKHL